MAEDHHHDGLDELRSDLRELLLDTIDRLDPLLEAARTGAPDATHATTCAVCPVCAVLAALRGERTALSIRLAEHAGGLLAVLRAALEEGDPAAHRPPRPTPAPRPARRTVQHIPVVR
ncbi:hypothetical protein ACQEVB_21115 [Pseudonocardia sp. CA-107938]|uniref:hypothetical protein n=1 Tax=Pseudonocardia sp. CA-107938 TaxID=3240021 RepID=UPI003D93E8A6